MKIKRIQEEAPTNSAGSGNIAGLGVGPDGEPGVAKGPRSKWKRKNEKNSPVMTDILRRKPTQTDLNMGSFAGNKTIKMSHEKFTALREAKKHGGKWLDYLGEDDYSQAIREYANKNWSAPIIFEDEKTGYMHFARYGKGKSRFF